MAMKSHSYFAANIKRSSACPGPLVPLSDMVRTFHVATTSSFERAAALAVERTTGACALAARRAGRPLLLCYHCRFLFVPLSFSLCIPSNLHVAHTHTRTVTELFTYEVLLYSSLYWFEYCCFHLNSGTVHPDIVHRNRKRALLTQSTVREEFVEKRAR